MKNILIPQNVLISSSNGNEYWNNGEIRAQESITIEGEFATTNGAKFSTKIFQWQDCSSLPPYNPYDPNDLKGTRIANQANSQAPNEQDNTTNIYKINTIEIYPNPNNGLFSVKINSIDNFDYLEIVNAQGAEINKQKNNGSKEIKIDLSRYPSGLYFIKSYFKGIAIISKLIKY